MWLSKYAERREEDARTAEQKREEERRMKDPNTEEGMLYARAVEEETRRLQQESDARNEQASTLALANGFQVQIAVHVQGIALHL